MPVYLHRDPSGSELVKRTTGLVGNPPCEFRESDSGCIDIGLLNNMPDAELQATERQFLTLLDRAAGSTQVRVSLYTLPEISRTDLGLCHMGSVYSGIEDLWDRHLDALIVTGTEPRTRNLVDEPYWESLTRVLEWADEGTHSTVLSCLSAHAALLHFDGIGRLRLGGKRFGLYRCVPSSDDRLIDGVPERFPMPQSRWNNIPENEVTDCGYDTLTRARDGCVEMLVKRRKSLFVLFQGHPEYEANSLWLGYRRDVARYLRRETETYPQVPRRYFDTDTTDALRVLQVRALCERSEELLADFPAAFAGKRLSNTWQSVATIIYGNWITYLCEQKQRRLRQQNTRGTLLSRAAAFR